MVFTMDATGSANGRERRQPKALREQLITLVPLLLAWALGLVVIVMAARQMLLADFPDPNNITRTSPYAATLSVMAVFGWAVAVTSAVWCGLVCRVGGRDTARSFIATGAVVAGISLFENLLAFHPSGVTDTAIPHQLLQAGACLLTVVWLWAFRHEIARTRVHVLGAAVVTQLMSLVIIPLGDGRTAGGILYEDGVRILGIFAWVAYLVSTSSDISRSVLASSMPRRDDVRVPAVGRRLSRRTAAGAGTATPAS